MLHKKENCFLLFSERLEQEIILLNPKDVVKNED